MSVVMGTWHLSEWANHNYCYDYIGQPLYEENCYTASKLFAYTEMGFGGSCIIFAFLLARTYTAIKNFSPDEEGGKEREGEFVSNTNDNNNNHHKNASNTADNSFDEGERGGVTEGKDWVRGDSHHLASSQDHATHGTHEHNSHKNGLNQRKHVRSISESFHLNRAGSHREKSHVKLVKSVGKPTHNTHGPKAIELTYMM